MQSMWNLWLHLRSLQVLLWAYVSSSSLGSKRHIAHRVIFLFWSIFVTVATGRLPQTQTLDSFYLWCINLYHWLHKLVNLNISNTKKVLISMFYIQRDNVNVCTLIFLVKMVVFVNGHYWRLLVFPFPQWKKLIQINLTKITLLINNVFIKMIGVHVQQYVYF